MSKLGELLKAAKQGAPEALYRLSYIYEEGEELDQDLDKAFSLNRQAADAGYERAYIRGMILEMQHKGLAGLAEAGEYGARALEAKDEEVRDAAMSFMAVLYGVSATCSGDDEAAEGLIGQLNEDMGVLSRIVREAVAYYGAQAYDKYLELTHQEEGSAEAGPAGQAEAQKYLENAIKAGDRRALVRRAMQYDAGDAAEGIEQDDAKAVEYFERVLAASNDSNGDVKYRLGLHYFGGSGVPEDREKAVRLLEQAGEEGVTDAFVFLGLSYNNGTGVAEDPAQAVAWLEKAVAADENTAPLAKGALGSAYLTGRGTATNYAKAAKLLREAADAGDLGAQITCAREYRKGFRLAYDLMMSNRYLDMILAQNSPQSEYIVASILKEYIEETGYASDERKRDDLLDALHHMVAATRSEDPDIAAKAGEELQTLREELRRLKEAQAETPVARPALQTQEKAETVSPRASEPEPAPELPADPRPFDVNTIPDPPKDRKKALLIAGIVAAVIITIVLATALLLPRMSPVAFKKGDTVRIGHYEQDNDRLNGAEEIEWIVLGVEGKKATLISKYGLAAGAINWEGEEEGATWETCSLRRWLNDYFLNTAFMPEEQSRLVRAKVAADPNPVCAADPGGQTSDLVYILSIKEAETYFTTDKSRICVPSDLLRSLGLEQSSGGCTWLLRTPGADSQRATMVSAEGVIDYYGRDNTKPNAIRPVIVLQLPG